MIERFESRQVSWEPVHAFVVHRLAGFSDWPAAGTPAWCELDDSDPRKLAAVIEAGEHWVLRLDCLQAAQAQAAHDISAAADWSSVARSMRAGRGSAYIPRIRRSA